jgi:hypothetical protein
MIIRFIKSTFGNDEGEEVRVIQETEDEFYYNKSEEGEVFEDIKRSTQAVEGNSLLNCRRVLKLYRGFKSHLLCQT